MAKARPIFIPGTNRQFSSASAAAKALGIDAGNIYKVLKGQRKTAGGYAFGYESNKTIYVPQTGQTFASASEAAKSLGVRKNRVQDVLSGRGNRQTVGGYNFVYADTTKLSPASEQAAPPPRKKATKQQRIQQSREKKQARFAKQQQREAERKQERSAATERMKQRDVERQRRLRLKPATEQYNTAKAELQHLLEKVNDKLNEYYTIHPNFIYYNPSAPDVAALQTIIGYTDDGYFDTSLSLFDVKTTNQPVEEIVKTYTEKTEELQRLRQVLNDATMKAKGRFWDINVAYGNRAAFALEFNISQNQMDEYAYLIWDMFDIFEEANKYQELGSDLVYNEVRDAMQGEIPAWKLQEFLGEIAAYMEGSRGKKLNEILSILDGYEKPSASVWDDEGWVI